MSDDYNPYQAPNSDIKPKTDDNSVISSQKMFTNTMLQHLRDTRPWVRLISIIMFILGGLMILAGIGGMFAGSVFTSDSTWSGFG